MFKYLLPPLICLSLLGLTLADAPPVPPITKDILDGKVDGMELRKARVPEKLEVLKGRGHGWGGKDKEHTDRLTVAWFDRHLKSR